MASQDKRSNRDRDDRNTENDRSWQPDVLSSRVMNALWECESATVADIAAKVKANYTTVASALQVLRRRELVTRTPASEGRAYLYSARYSRAEVEKAIVTQNVHRVLDGNASLGLSRLVSLIDGDARLLEELRDAVERKRTVPPKKNLS